MLPSTPSLSSIAMTSLPLGSCKISITRALCGLWIRAGKAVAHRQQNKLQCLFLYLEASRTDSLTPLNMRVGSSSKPCRTALELALRANLRRRRTNRRDFRIHRQDILIAIALIVKSRLAISSAMLEAWTAGSAPGCAYVSRRAVTISIVKGLLSNSKVAVPKPAVHQDSCANPVRNASCQRGRIPHHRHVNIIARQFSKQSRTDPPSR